MSTEPTHRRTPPTERRAEREREVRRRILAAGRTVVGADGLAEARIEEITRAAGIAKGTFYLYFGSKEDLVRALVDDAFRELAHACDRVADDPEATWSERLAALTHAQAELLEAEPDRLRLLHQALAALRLEDPEWRPLAQSLRGHLDRLAGRIVAAPAPAGLDRRAALELAALLFGGVFGAAALGALGALGSLGSTAARTRRLERIGPSLAAACTSWIGPGSASDAAPEVRR